MRDELNCCALCTFYFTHSYVLQCIVIVHLYLDLSGLVEVIQNVQFSLIYYTPLYWYVYKYTICTICENCDNNYTK